MTNTLCILLVTHLVNYCLQLKVICRCIRLPYNLQVYTASRIKSNHASMVPTLCFRSIHGVEMKIQYGS